MVIHHLPTGMILQVVEFLMKSSRLYIIPHPLKVRNQAWCNINDFFVDAEKHTRF